MAYRDELHLRNEAGNLAIVQAQLLEEDDDAMRPEDWAYLWAMLAAMVVGVLLSFVLEDTRIVTTAEDLFLKYELTVEHIYRIIC